MTVPVITVKSLRHSFSAQRYQPGFLIAYRAVQECRSLMAGWNYWCSGRQRQKRQAGGGVSRRLAGAMLAPQALDSVSHANGNGGGGIVRERMALATANGKLP